MTGFGAQVMPPGLSLSALAGSAPCVLAPSSGSRGDKSLLQSQP